MSHWTKTAVITMGLAAGIGAGVAWTSPSNSLPDGRESLTWFSQAIAPDLYLDDDAGTSLSSRNSLNSSPSMPGRSPAHLGPVVPEMEERDSIVRRRLAEPTGVEDSATAFQTVDVLVAQAPRQSPSVESEQDSVLEPGTSSDNEEADATNGEQAPNSQAPTPQTSPQPQFSPVIPRPLERTSTNPGTEIRAIRRELLQLLNRLEELETRLESGTDTSVQTSPNPASPDSNLANSNSSPSSQSSPPASSFFDGPPPPQLSLGTQTISLPGDVLFDFNRSEIRPEAASMLEQVAGILESMPYSHIQVAGHTDDVGDNNYNLVLSVERATAVQEFLREALPDNGQGYRWTSTGYGEAAPVADNGTEEGRQRNRRVDLIVSPQ
ncbi:MAG: OmpA family protein [Cyanobacteria bacterium P01_E01_bin.34]